MNEINSISVYAVGVGSKRSIRIRLGILTTQVF